LRDGSGSFNDEILRDTEGSDSDRPNESTENEVGELNPNLIGYISNEILTSKSEKFFGELFVQLGYEWVSSKLVMRVAKEGNKGR